MMQLIDTPIGNPVVVLREEFDDWAVLFNPDTADALGINPVGVAVWKRLDGRRTLAEIAGDLGEEFSTVPDTAPADVLAFAETLQAQGFVGTEFPAQEGSR
jgi:SynChlorMet cassette protein ScmD